VDPANRLVASELEARWNAALANAAQAEAQLAAAMREEKPPSDKERQRILGLGADLERVWNDPTAPVEIKKRIVRTVIREVIVGVDHEKHELDVVVHWAGGAHTRLRVAKNKVGLNKHAASPETVELVRELARGWTDKYIAQMLNRFGSRTGCGNGWSETRVKSFRGQHGIPVFSAGSVRPWLTMEEAAKDLGVNVAVIRTLVQRGKLPARQIAQGLPWLIERHDLTRPEVVNRVRDAKLGKRSPREETGQIVMTSI
jgi:excisionase family DNA binding protein